MLPRLAITAGEPAGIGPDICLLAAVQQSLPAQLVVIADPALLAARAALLGLNLQFKHFVPSVRIPCLAGQVLVHPIPLQATCQPGHPDPSNSAYVLHTLKTAVQGCQSGVFDAMVTAPVHKAVINEAGIPFSGHTEWLATQTNTRQVVMMLATKTLRVALATTHLPLADVPAAITRPLLTATLTILHQALQHTFAISAPRILVCGLNPHAGERGHLGQEEIDTIIPVLKTLRATSMQLTGPLPADTVFSQSHRQQADAILAMYHDQGLPVLKYQGFGQAVNVTLGLPLIRTSVDHGTALPLSGTGKVSSHSLIAAMQMAIDIVHRTGTDQKPC